MLSYEQASKILKYDPKSGTIFWASDSFGGFKKSVKIHSAGDLAGCAREDGRWVIRANDRLYMRYRLAWLLHNGEWPNGEIDHINGKPDDDRISNLRVVTRVVNQQNLRRALAGKTSSRLLGVYLDKRKSRKKWRSAIQVNGRQVSLGYFLTEEEAHEAYIAAKRMFHEGCTI